MIRGSKTYLRPLVTGDTETVLEWENMREIWHLSGTSEPFTREEIRQHINGMGDLFVEKQIRNMICELSGRPIGLIDAFDYDPGSDSVWIGILIAKSTDRGKGFGRDALLSWVRYLIDTLQVQVLKARVYTANQSSVNLFRNSGFAEMPDPENAETILFILNSPSA